MKTEIQGINCDDKGNIYAGTFHGLYKIDAVTHNYIYYTSEDGVNEDVQYTRMYRLTDGRMLEGGLNSFIYFDPSELKKTFIPPDVQITGFKIFDKQYEPGSLLDKSNKIHLNYQDNFITIQYASLYYNAPEKIHYYYKLVGINKNWVNAGDARYATYTNLNNGNYTFEIKCINDEGIACKSITSFHIIIAAPYYKTWWFMSLSATAAFGLIFIFYNYRMKAMKKFIIMRQRIASDLHDDIGSTLNSISVYSEIASQQLKQDNNGVKTILTRMGNASRNMIDNMNDIVWAINPKNDEFKNVLFRMHYFAGELLSGKNILLQFDAEENLQKIKLTMEKRKNFYLIFKEAINNAYKYSESKNVDISIGEKEGSLFMIISDNGKGFNKAGNGLGGNGLKNMKMRADEISAKLEISSWQGKGTRIFLSMKL